MSEIKLFPCPFCGGEVKLMAIAGEPYPPTYEVNMETVTKKSDDICYIHCPTCKTNWHKEVRIDSFPMDTIKAWNTRKPVDDIVGQLEKEFKKYYGNKWDKAPYLVKAIDIVRNGGKG